jgi:hypothetical protein
MLAVGQERRQLVLPFLACGVEMRERDGRAAIGGNPPQSRRCAAENNHAIAIPGAAHRRYGLVADVLSRFSHDVHLPDLRHVAGEADVAAIGRPIKRRRPGTGACLREGAHLAAIEIRHEDHRAGRSIAKKGQMAAILREGQRTGLGDRGSARNSQRGAEGRQCGGRSRARVKNTGGRQNHCGSGCGCCPLPAVRNRCRLSGSHFRRPAQQKTRVADVA